MCKKYRRITVKESHIVPELKAPVRLQEYGVGIFQHAMTKSALKKVLKKEYVLVNKTIATSATMIHGGETIVLSMPTNNVSKKLFNLKLCVVYEDDHLAVIEKPAGLLVNGNSFKTVANALAQNLLTSNLDDATNPQPVHRLDFATTGLLLIGKTSSSIRSLNALFEAKKVEKTYYAITIGAMETTGCIDKPIEGKSAITHFEVRQTVPSRRFGCLNLDELQPVTGKRHQLRIHMSHMGNPILGDRQYSQAEMLLQGKGMYLHAFSLKFIHPYSNKLMLIQSTLPERFQKIFPETTDA